MDPLHVHYIIVPLLMPFQIRILVNLRLKRLQKVNTQKVQLSAERDWAQEGPVHQVLINGGDVDVCLFISALCRKNCGELSRGCKFL